MINFINSIPAEFGWASVGFIACLCCVAAYKLGKVLLEMWKERHEDEDEEN